MTDSPSGLALPRFDSAALDAVAAHDVRTRDAAEQLGREFEAMLLLQMVRSMRQAMLEEQGPDDGLGAGTMTDTFDAEFARQLSGQGGLGIGQALADQVTRQLAGRGVAGGASVGTATLRPPAGGVEPIETSALHSGQATRESLPALTVPLAAPVSSPFGWRADPLHGEARFHRGIDLKAAYGREVPTAAGGRVVFAGEQGGYGQTVVVDHAGGYRTRYAHLSAIDVSVGQELAQGAIVGRVGRTGRATGPHLHFEVSKDGQTVNPEELARANS
ncbi:MAG: peptidoglycan DD-metalloendopeptidase family protein [Vicinamibacterales bacterium]